ncbi:MULTISPECIES: WD40 repeat domain-containing protein [unclassified Spirillospora]|uniref:WD40 repeat domain-containing protein n=1 Tax=unclassified Spirillospora TaxID=2642701 RepID=UPI00371D4CAD
MSTDIYGVRVLAVHPDELRISFRIFVVYYDTHSQTYGPEPDDPTFFFSLLWERGPLHDRIDVATSLDGEWIDANTRRFVSGVERLATRNHPPSPEQWKELCDFYYEHGGYWQDEDLLVQFDYDVYVTDRRWIESFSEGDAWGTTAFPYNADMWTAEDAPNIPDLTAPALTVSPFDVTTGDIKYDGVIGAEFSDDGRYLALCSDKGRVWVYETTGWSQVVHVSSGVEWILPLMAWVPGEPVITLKNYCSRPDEDDRTQWAYHVDARAEVGAPFQPGRIRSRGGGYWTGNYNNRDGGIDICAPDRPPIPTSVAGDGWDPIQCESFAGDGSHLFLGARENLYVLDPATGRIKDKVMKASTCLFKLAASPDGAYLAASSFSRKLPYLDVYGHKRPHELCVWRTSDMKIIMGRQLTTWVKAMAWSPDGQWLAVTVEPTTRSLSLNGRSQLMIYRMGPSQPPFPVEQADGQAGADSSGGGTGSAPG